MRNYTYQFLQTVLVQQIKKDMGVFIFRLKYINPQTIKQMDQPKRESHLDNSSQNLQAAKCHQISSEIANGIVLEILGKVFTRINKNDAFRQSLKMFSQFKAIRNIKQINQLNVKNTDYVSQQLTPACSQPLPLFVDSLLPISADIDLQNTYKKNLKNMISFDQQLSSSIKQRPKKIIQTDVYKKLDCKQEEQDGFTKELRKMQEDKTTKQSNEKKAKELEQSILNEKLKDKKKQKQQKFSFDYNGSQIKVRNQSKTNLISKYINQNLNSNTKTVKQAFNDKNPTTVDSVVKNQKKNSQNGLKRKDDVFFSENRSLSQGVTVNGGVKYTYQGKTLQSKVKNYSTVELKKQMHQRRLSKEQFMRVKSLNGSGMSIMGPQESFRETRMKKTMSMQDVNKFKEKESQRQRIVINSQNLRKQLLLKINEYQQQIKEPENPEKEVIQMGFIDVFNMNYLKSGGNFKSQSNGKLSTRQSSYLPKIVHTSIQTHSIPKQREKIKELSLIRSELRKRFDDKLRI